MTKNIDTTTVTAEQIAKCTRCYDSNNVPFYMVESEDEKFNDDGSRVEYKVTWNSAKKCFFCTCPSGLEGFASCHNKNGVCKHVVWSVAAARQWQEEQAALTASYPTEKQMDAMAAYTIAEDIYRVEKPKLGMGPNGYLIPMR